jgi:hypothetical protein
MLLLASYLLFRQKRADFVLRCEKLSLGLQAENQNHLRSLLAMNNRAASLLRQHQKAQLHLQVALRSGNVAAITAARAALQMVMAERKKLDLEQQTILSVSQLDMQSWRKKIAQDNPGAKVTHPPGLVVDSHGPRPAPVYVPKANFENLQAVHVSAQWNPSEIRSWLPKNLQELVPQMRWTCGATLRKENKQWKAHLLPDRRSSNL